MCIRDREDCFQRLTEYLREAMPQSGRGTQECLELYFNARMEFFQKNPLYQRIFCDAVILPPAHLKTAVGERKAGFDALNIEILMQILACLLYTSGSETASGLKFCFDIDICH